MAEPCRIRDATERDLDAIVALESVAFSDPWPRASFASLLRAIVLVAERDGALIGYVVARPVHDEAEILNLAVRSDERRRGVARRLMEEVHRRVTAAGVRAVFLEVRESNAGARRFYGTLGYSHAGRRRAYYERPREDALILARKLPSDTAGHRG